MTMVRAAIGQLPFQRAKRGPPAQGTIGHHCQAGHSQQDQEHIHSKSKHRSSFLISVQPRPGIRMWIASGKLVSAGLCSSDSHNVPHMFSPVKRIRDWWSAMSGELKLDFAANSQ
jgi:hypothetical protein